MAEEGKVVKTAVNFPVGHPLEIYIDGPYGAPSSHIFRAQHAVLIGTGIGVTPFASILQSIMHRYYKGEKISKKLTNLIQIINFKSSSPSPMSPL